MLRFIVWLCLAGVPGLAAGVVDHELTVDINPQAGELRITDRVTLPAAARELVVPRAARDLVWLSGNPKQLSNTAARRWRLVDAGTPTTLSASYVLTLDVRGGELAPTGVSLGGAAPWYIRVPGALQRFHMTVTTPQGWRAVSQGTRLSERRVAAGRRAVWRESRPQQALYLVAAPFHEYRREPAGGGPRLKAFLRQDDAALAARYLDLAERYIDLYSDLIGDYPYAKFALVENSWQSGLGMPSFTLLGSRVIRLPFIPYTSYPHEVLHNWWGNSVYVDDRSGNWSEGLTTYLADHRFKVQRGEGAAYRRDALQEYRDFVSAARDFPLTKFRARRGEASQAVGYNKSMMLFHMLRQHLGDDAFFAALRDFYRAYRFKRASFWDLAACFAATDGHCGRPDSEKASAVRGQAGLLSRSSKAVGGEHSGTPQRRSRRLPTAADAHQLRQAAWVMAFFEQWLTRTGAPRLALDGVGVAEQGGHFVLSGRLRQTQAGAAYRLRVPLRIATVDGPRWEHVDLVERTLDFEILLDARPRALSVDPRFDLFRRLATAETPPTFGAGFGSAGLTFVVPRAATAAQRAAHAAFIDTWRGPDRQLRTIADDAPLPENGAIWLLGWNNARRVLLERRLRPVGVRIEGDMLRVAGKRYRRTGHSVALVARLDAQTPRLSPGA